MRVGESRSFYSRVTSGGRTVDVGEETKRPVCASGGAGGALKNAPSIETESADLHAYSRDNRCTAVTKRPRIFRDADGALDADRLSHTVELAERNRGHEVISGCDWETKNKRSRLDERLEPGWLREGQLPNASCGRMT
jgi:hypothetical protein